MPSLPRSARWSLPAVCAVTLAMLLWLPYRFAVAPSVSDSYLFGFNNHVALVLILGFAVAIAFCLRSWTFAPVRESPGFRLPGTFLYGSLGLMLLVSGALCIPVIRLGGIEESIYLVDRVKLVLEGHRPGADFEFAYGPLLLYGPAWLTRLPGLSAAAAYGLFWIVLNLSGVAMLYATLQGIDVPFRFRRAAFLFFLVVAFVNLLSTGMNYSLFRFASPCFLTLVVYRLLGHVESSWLRPLGILAVAPCYAFLLSVSPELALSFGCGMGLFLVLSYDLRPWRTMVCFLAMVGLLGLATWVASTGQVFATLNAFRTGGYNFPILPAPHILVFLLALAVVSAFLLQRLRLGQPNMVVALTLVSAGSVVGAFGRCDPVHVLLDPLGCWIAAFVLAGSLKSFGGIWVAVTVCVYVLLDAPPSVSGSAANLAKAAIPTIFAHEPEDSHGRLDRFLEERSAKTFGAEKARGKLAELRFVAHHQGAIDVDRLYGEPPRTVFEAPFGFAPSHSGTYHTPEVDQGFYFGLENVLTPEAVQRKLAELKDHPERPLLMLATQESSCSVDPERERQAISSLFFYPYRAAAKHPGSILEPFCSYIRTHYRVEVPAAPEHFGYAVWRRVPGGDPASSAPGALE